MFEAPAALVLGWLADRGAGDPVRGHRVAGFGRLAGGLEARVWRPSRLVGAFYAGALVGAAGVVSALAWRLTDRWPLARIALGSAVVWTALGGRSLERAALTLAATIEEGDLAAARALLPALAGRDPTPPGATQLCPARAQPGAEDTPRAPT